MMRPLLFLLLLASCAVGCKPPTLETTQDQCREIDWRTMRDGKPASCRVLACRATEDHVFPVVLWCDEIKPECGQ